MKSRTRRNIHTVASAIVATSIAIGALPTLLFIGALGVAAGELNAGRGMPGTAQEWMVIGYLALVGTVCALVATAAGIASITTER